MDAAKDGIRASPCAKVPTMASATNIYYATTVGIMYILEGRWNVCSGPHVIVNGYNIYDYKFQQKTQILQGTENMYNYGGYVECTTGNWWFLVWEILEVYEGLK